MNSYDKFLDKSRAAEMKRLRELALLRNLWKLPSVKPEKGGSE